MKYFTITLILVLSMALIGCSGDSNEGQAKNSDLQAAMVDQSAEIGSQAPDFTLMSAEGEMHSLADYKGNYIVLEWINFDCPFVKKHYHSGNMPNLQKYYRDMGVTWLTICSSAPGKQGYFNGLALTDRIERENWYGDVYLIDSDGKVGRMYGAKTTPHMYIIDPAGNLIYMGAIDDKASTDQADIEGATNYVRMALDKAKAGEEIMVNTTKAYGCSVKY